MLSLAGALSKRVALISASLAALALLPSCGAQDAAQSPTQPPTESSTSTGETETAEFKPPGTGEQLDWDDLANPDLIDIPTLEAAGPHLFFTPVLPDGLGSPSKILMLDPTVAPPRERGLALRYDHPTYGLFWVLEDALPPGISLQQLQADLEALVECDPAQGCEGEWSMETIRGGIRGLLTIAPPTHGATGITWYENGVQFNVIGPPDSFTGEEAIAVANSI